MVCLPVCIDEHGACMERGAWIIIITIVIGGHTAVCVAHSKVNTDIARS